MTRIQYNENIITLALVKYAGVNPRTFDLLLQSFQSLEDLLLAEESELAEIGGISRSVALKIAQVGEYLEKASAYSSVLAKRDIRIITRFEADYPPQLIQINDPPPLLYNRGRTPDINLKSIALVGTETASQAGMALTTRLVKELVTQEVQVLSTLGEGIAAAAHLGCKAVGGHSFAVLDGGFDQISGDSEIPLAIDIVQSGGIFSEYPPDESINKDNFKQSNRLLAGMAQAVVVTEFYKDSARVHDLLEYCNQIGKLSFIMTDSQRESRSDEDSLALAVKRGAIPMSGFERINDIIKSLV